MKRDIAFVEHDGESILMNIATPIDGPTTRGAVLWIHGGGWAGGSRDGLNYLAEYSAKLGLVSATTDYRLSTGGHCFPSQVHDVVAAYRHLVDNADKLKIDPNKIIVGGDSAGGHLALMLGLCNNTDVLGVDTKTKKPRVAGIINIYGPTDLPAMYNPSPTAFILQSLLTNFMGGKLPDMREKWTSASPVEYVCENGPPILTIHGNLDSVVPYDQVLRLRDACKKVGQDHHLIRVSGADHGFASIPQSREMTAVLPAIAFFIGKAAS